MLDKLIRNTFIVFFLSFLLIPLNSEAQKRKKKDRKPDNVERTEIPFRNGDSNAEAEFYFIEAMRYALMADNEKAIKYFEKVIDLKPEEAAAHYKIADLYLSQGDTRKALPYAKKALELDGKEKSYYLLLARIYEFEQDYQKASNTLQNLLNNVEGSEEHYFDLALIQTYLEDYENALNTYQKVEDAFGTSPEISQQKQRLLLRLNRLDEAIQEGYNLIEAYPNDQDLVYDQVKLLLSNDKKVEARKILKEILIEDGDNPEALILMSDIYRSEDKIDSANVILNKAFTNPKLDSESKMAIISNLLRFTYDESEKSSLLELNEILSKSYPDDNRVQAFSGDIFLNYQRKDKALEAYKKSIRLDDSDLMIWTNIVLLHFEMEEYDSVIKYSEMALEVFPNQGRLWFMNGLGYYSNNDFDGAKTNLEQAKKYVLEETGMRGDILSTLGDTYNNLEEFKKSDDAYEEALKLNPNNEHVLNNYSYFLSLRGENLDKALEMCEKLMRNTRDNSTYLDTYAWVLYKMGRYEDALKNIEMAVGESASGVVYEHYGDILYKLDRKEEAFKAWEKASGFEDKSELLDKKIKDQKLYE